MSTILRTTFWQLLFVYTLAVALIALASLWKYRYHFELFALIVAIFGISTFKSPANKNIPHISKLFFFVALAFMLFSRILPYTHNLIPLGYDAGLYRSTFILDATNNIPLWISSWSPPGLPSITTLLLHTGLNVDQLLIPVFIFLNLLCVFSIYLVGKEYFNESSGILSALFFSISITQFKAFELMYYKNIVAITILLFTLYLIKKEKFFLATIAGGFLGGLHRPTFLLFGLSYFLYFITSSYSLKMKSFTPQTKKRFLTGLFMLIIATSMYITTFNQSIAPLAIGAVRFVGEASLTRQAGGGTFINFFTYQYLSLAYLPLALLGFFLIIRSKNFNLLFWWGVVNGIIVYFKLLFFNRFIIHLDILFVIFSGYALYHLLCAKRWLALIISIVLIVSMSYAVYDESRTTIPLIRHKEMAVIQSLQFTEWDARILSTTSYYSPWLEGYTGRIVIAPGLFDANKWSQKMWQSFWDTGNNTLAKELLSYYTPPIYIFNGEFGGRINQKKFDNDSCFTEWYNDNRTRIIKYQCHTSH